MIDVSLRNGPRDDQVWMRYDQMAPTSPYRNDMGGIANHAAGWACKAPQSPRISCMLENERAPHVKRTPGRHCNGPREAIGHQRLADDRQRIRDKAREIRSLKPWASALDPPRQGFPAHLYLGPIFRAPSAGRNANSRRRAGG